MDTSWWIKITFMLIGIATYIESGQCKLNNRKGCSFHNATTAGLSLAYAAETFVETRRFPDLSRQRSRNRVNGTPWWGNSRRDRNTNQCFTNLRKRIRSQLRWRLFRRLRLGRSLEIEETMSNLKCYGRNTATGDEVYRVCGECVRTTDLGVDRFPRYLNELVCDPRNSADALSGEGVCVQKSIQITVKRQFQNDTEVEEDVSFSTGCEFRMYHGSVLIQLNTET